MRIVCRIPLYLWTLPATLCGLWIVPLILLEHGSVRIVNGVLEVHGGIVSRRLKAGSPWTGPIAAIAFGHVVLGYDALCLSRTRVHERIHVKQYELWGPFFIPAYLLASLVLRLRGKDPYHENPFEKEARAKAKADTPYR